MLTVVVAVLSDKLKWRGPFMLMLLPLTAVGESGRRMHCSGVDQFIQVTSLRLSPRYVRCTARIEAPLMIVGQNNVQRYIAGAFVLPIKQVES